MAEVATEAYSTYEVMYKVLCAANVYFAKANVPEAIRIITLAPRWERARERGHR
jgi:hypothetical protein